MAMRFRFLLQRQKRIFSRKKKEEITNKKRRAAVALNSMCYVFRQGDKYADSNGYRYSCRSAGSCRILFKISFVLLIYFNRFLASHSVPQAHLRVSREVCLGEERKTVCRLYLSAEPKYTAIGEHFGKFEIDGCYPGYGATLGNALRRFALIS